MKIGINKIPPEGIEINQDIPIDSLDTQDLEDPMVHPLHLRGSVHAAGESFIVKGDLLGAWNLQCARCLERFQFKVEKTFQIGLIRKRRASFEKTLDLNIDDLDESELAGDEIDIGAIIREQMILSIPIKPICSDSCQGLCVVCGQNKNIIQCVCQMPVNNPKFNKLKDLLQK